MNHRTGLTVSMVIVAVCVVALVTVLPAFTVNVPFSFSITHFDTATPEATATYTTDNSPLISYEIFCSAFSFLSPPIQQQFISQGINCQVDSQGNLMVPSQWTPTFYSSPMVQSIITWAKGVSCCGVPQATITTTSPLPPITFPHVELMSATSTVKEPLFQVARVPSLIILIVVVAGVALCFILERRRRHPS